MGQKPGTGSGENTESDTGENSEIQTAAHGQVDAGTRQTFYLWEEGNMPSETEYTENNGGYADDPDFRPTVRTFPVPEGTEVKGAVLICAGGAFQYRSDQLDDSYVPDELDQVSADASACGMIYAFYGRLSVPPQTWKSSGSPIFRLPILHTGPGILL